jgi:DNA polymerase III delta prime subunit
VINLHIALDAQADVEQQQARNVFGESKGLATKVKSATELRENYTNLLSAQIVREARAAIAEQARSFARVFPENVLAAGLSDIVTLPDTIETRARSQLQSLVKQMQDSGTIGLSGPRGAGKTTLLKWFCRPDLTETPSDARRICVVVSAPVSYDARDFILHLFSELCSETLAFAGYPPDVLAQSEIIVQEKNQERSEHVSSLIEKGSKVMLALGGLFSFIGVIAVVAAIVESGTTAPTTTPPAPASDYSDIFGTLLGMGPLLGLLGCIAFLYRNQLARGIVAPSFAPNLERTLASLKELEPRPRYATNPPNPNFWSPVVAAAYRHLWEIQFQLSFSSGWEGSLEISGLGASHTETENIARNQRTLPRIVDEFHRFVRALPDNTRVVIGIDEMDKIGDAEKAQQFLNDVKAMFGSTPRCLFLLSVSESAMSSFQRRGLAVRDAFDSSFHEILNVRQLSLDESSRLLERRIIGLPVPFLALCYCISGGLARDLVRACRKIIHASGALLGDGPPNGADIVKVTSAVLQGEINGHATGVLALLDRLEVEPALSNFTSLLNQLREVDWRSPNLLVSASKFWKIGTPSTTAATEDDDVKQQRTQLAVFARETSAHTYYLATVHKLFSSETFSYTFGSAEASAFEKRINQLAEVWQQGAGNPTLVVSKARKFWISQSWASDDDFPAV